MCFIMVLMRNSKINSPEVVRDVYESGRYFKDAYDWYALKYLNPFVERFYLFLYSILSLTIVFIVAIIVKNLFPIKETFPILVNQKDSSLYASRVTRLRPTDILYNNNQSIGRYLSIYYLRLLTEHNYINSTMNDLNETLEKLKRYSSKTAFDKSQDLVNGVYKSFFGKNIIQRSVIRSFKFVDLDNTVFSRSISKDKNTYAAEMRYTIFINNNGTVEKKNKKIVLTFKFNDIKYNNITKQFNPIIFLVMDYSITDLK